MDNLLIAWILLTPAIWILGSCSIIWFFYDVMDTKKTSDVLFCLLYSLVFFVFSWWGIYFLIK